jgi:hypothetical protein
MAKFYSLKLPEIHYTIQQRGKFKDFVFMHTRFTKGLTLLEKQNIP